MIKKWFNFFKGTSKKEPEIEKFPYQMYEDFISSNKSFDDLDVNIQQTLMNYVGIQCSSLFSNSYNIRVSYEDLIKHFHREINIFVLQEHFNYPTKDSPNEIYLGNTLWVLDKETYKYILKSNTFPPDI